MNPQSTHVREKIICSLLESERERKWIRWKTVRFIPWRHPHKPEWRLSDLTKEKVQAQAGYTMTPTSKQIISVRNWAPLFHQMHTLHRIHPRPPVVRSSSAACSAPYWHQKQAKVKGHHVGGQPAYAEVLQNDPTRVHLRRIGWGRERVKRILLKFDEISCFLFPKCYFKQQTTYQTRFTPPQLMCAHICEWP